jgi:hypothetical protein
LSLLLLAGKTVTDKLLQQKHEQELQHDTQQDQQQQPQQQLPHHQLDLLQLFKAGCPNLGVHQMARDLKAAAARGRRVHIAVLGPATDVACLLLHWPELAARAVEAVFWAPSLQVGPSNDSCDAVQGN